MSSTKALFLLTFLLLLAGTTRAQTNTGSPPSPAPKPLTVSVELPRALGMLSDCAKIVFSRQDEGDNKLGRLVARIRTRKNKPVVTLQVDVPKNKVTKTLGIFD